jgi:hypothetical protein
MKVNVGRNSMAQLRSGITAAPARAPMRAATPVHPWSPRPSPFPHRGEIHHATMVDTSNG